MFVIYITKGQILAYPTKPTMKLTCMRACSVAQTRLTLTVQGPMDCILSGSSVHRISQARILEGVAISSFRGSSWPRDQTHASCISYTSRWFFTPEPPGKKPWNWHSEWLKTSWKEYGFGVGKTSLSLKAARFSSFRFLIFPVLWQDINTLWWNECLDVNY